MKGRDILPCVCGLHDAKHVLRFASENGEKRCPAFYREIIDEELHKLERTADLLSVENSSWRKRFEKIADLAGHYSPRNSAPGTVPLVENREVREKPDDGISGEVVDADGSGHVFFDNGLMLYDPRRACQFLFKKLIGVKK